MQVEFSYARDDDFYFSVSLDKFSSNDERWGMADFRVTATILRRLLSVKI